MDENTPADADTVVLTKVTLCCERILQKSAALIDESGREYRFVLGPVLEPNTVDLQKQWISPDEIERVCHGFMARFQQVGVKHNRLAKSTEAVIVQCYMMPCDGEVGGEKLKKDTMMLGVRCYGDLIPRVDSGELCAFSIEGHCELKSEIPPG